VPLSGEFAGVVTSVLIMDFVDTMGSLFGLSSRAGLLDAEGNLPDIEKPMLVDALSTVIASLFGTTTAGIYIESATGIEQGGRTGFTAIVVAGFFVLALFFRRCSPSSPFRLRTVHGHCRLIHDCLGPENGFQRLQ